MTRLDDVAKARLLGNIMARLRKEADEAFDPVEAIDSDGYDQGKREGFLTALEIVKDEFYKTEKDA